MFNNKRQLEMTKLDSVGLDLSWEGYIGGRSWSVQSDPTETGLKWAPLMEGRSEKKGWTNWIKMICIHESFPLFSYTTYTTCPEKFFPKETE